MSALFPPALKRGDTIAFVAPAGRVDLTRVDRARRRLEDMGFQVRVPRGLGQIRGYLAGDDTRRADELMAAFQDDRVAAVLPVRGGYGTTRLLDRLDYGLIGDHPKIVAGFSDITALHLAIGKETGLITFHSPHPMDGLGLEESWDAISAWAFWRAVLEDEYFEPDGRRRPSGYACTAEATREAVTTLVPGIARGRLTGGNLSLVCALLGTRYEIDTRGRVLLLEETDECPYRIDRYLCQLRLAGKLDSLAGVLIGHLTNCRADVPDRSLSVDQVLADYFTPLQVPSIVGFPVGHAQPNMTLPLGALVEIDADHRQLNVLEDPVSLSTVLLP